MCFELYWLRKPSKNKIRKYCFCVVYDRYIGCRVYDNYTFTPRRGCSAIYLRRVKRDFFLIHVYSLFDCSTLTLSVSIRVPQVILRVTATFSVQKINLISLMNRIQHFFNTFNGPNIDIFDSSVQMFRHFPNYI